MNAAGHHAVAVRLARAAEQLFRASAEANALGAEWRESVIAWNREGDDLLARSLHFHHLAYAIQRDEAAQMVAV